jgi:hypothetical protein
MRKIKWKRNGIVAEKYFRLISASCFSNNSFGLVWVQSENLQHSPWGYADQCRIQNTRLGAGKQESEQGDYVADRFIFD